MTLEQYVEVQEAAERLRLSENTIRNWCKLGEIDGATKIGNQWRLPEASVKKLIEEGYPQRVPSGIIKPQRSRLASVNGRRW